MSLDDAADLAERRSDPATAEFQAWTIPYPLDKATAMIEGMIAQGGPQLGSWFQFAMDRREDGVTVGDLAFRLADDGRNAELGFTLHPWARGQGFATEGGRALLEYGFTVWGVHRFEASCHPGNVASSRLLGTLGFRYEGTSIESYWVGDVVSDDAHYALLRREWEGPESAA
jgi:aminoglycoside 6'-N-acetyltransferase